MSGRALERDARSRLRRFRQGSALAVALTGMILLLWGVGPEDAAAGDAARAPAAGDAARAPAAEEQGVDLPAPPGAGPTAGVVAVEPRKAAPRQAPSQDPVPEEAFPQEDTFPPDTLAPETPPPDTLDRDTLPPDPSRAVEEATGTIRDLALGFWGFLPKLLIALVLLVIAGFIARILNRLFRQLPGTWERAEALGATAGILVWLMAIGAALSVLAGDARALLGSVGLLGLALSWALQAPIESFAGWVLNSFRGYYRVGDRIAVGDVFGDVYRIDFLTTTVWQAGGADTAVRGAQPTGASVTLPNSEVLRTNLVNYTRDFPFVWDEITTGVGHGTDLEYAVGVLQEVADEVVGKPMAEPAALYLDLLRREGLEYNVPTDPQIFVSEDESWTNLTVRYLIPSRERRLWSTRMTLAAARELAREEHRGRIRPGFPRLEIDATVGDSPP